MARMGGRQTRPGFRGCGFPSEILFTSETIVKRKGRNSRTVVLWGTVAGMVAWLVLFSKGSGPDREPARPSGKIERPLRGQDL